MSRVTRLIARCLLAAAPAIACVPFHPAAAEGVLTVAMTAGDLPVTTGNPDQGFEGFRFVGFNLYDALINWDLSKKDQASDIKPGLATEWHVDPNNHKRWIFTLRQGVKWHDGCDFTADDVVWNFGRIADPKAPQFYTQQFALARAYLTNYDSIEKIDDHTVAINTKFVESLFPYDMSYVLMVSRCRAEALHNDWNAYANQPSGTGPYKFAGETAHERMELLPNKDYWDKDRVPKQDRLILLPMPEAATRTAALLSGQVNFIEAPAPDAIPVLKRAGMQIITNTYPHNWPYILNFTHGPFMDLRVRQAANYAINRDDSGSESRTEPHGETLIGVRSWNQFCACTKPCTLGDKARGFRSCTTKIISACADSYSCSLVSSTMRLAGSNSSKICFTKSSASGVLKWPQLLPAGDQ
jgi:peptide/nickel transport system substrate-binding protein